MSGSLNGRVLRWSLAVQVLRAGVSPPPLQNPLSPCSFGFGTLANATLSCWTASSTRLSNGVLNEWVLHPSLLFLCVRGPLCPHSRRVTSQSRSIARKISPKLVDQLPTSRRHGKLSRRTFVRSSPALADAVQLPCSTGRRSISSRRPLFSLNPVVRASSSLDDDR